jgi:hypothetical protein
LRKPTGRPWLVGISATAAAFAAAVTWIGAATSPPPARVPSGHILYLDADQPSEKTTMLHGMYLVGHDGRQQPILREQEPQDVDAGEREWIIEPAESPDGRRVAFLKELFTILDEKQSATDQIWVADLPVPHPNPLLGKEREQEKSAHLLQPEASPGKGEQETEQPYPSQFPVREAPLPVVGRMVLDLTARHMYAVTRLTWTPDGKITFLDGATRYAIFPDGGSLATAAVELPGVAATYKGVSNTALVAAASQYGAVYQVHSPGRIFWSPTQSLGWTSGAGVTAAAVSADGGTIALHEDRTNSNIVIMSGGKGRELTARYGWSLFGGRRVTSLRFSPDGKYLGYTVSKPPIAEDEMFYMDLQSGRCFKLPYRCGPSAWDWGP